MEEALFSRRVLDALPAAARVERLQQLSAELSKRLEGLRDRVGFFAEMYRLVEELKAIGHDLWSFDSDGETFEGWGGDHARPERAGELSVIFTVGEGARARWFSIIEPSGSRGRSPP